MIYSRNELFLVMTVFSYLFNVGLETFSVFIFNYCSSTEHVVLTNQQKQELLERYRYCNSEDYSFKLYYWLSNIKLNCASC